MEYWSSDHKCDHLLSPSIAKRWASLSSQFHAIRTYNEARIWKDTASQLCDQVKMSIEGIVDDEISNDNVGQLKANDTYQGLNEFISSFFALLPSDEREKENILGRLRLQKENLVAERREIKAEIRISKLSLMQSLPGRLLHRLGEFTGSKRRSPAHRDKSSQAKAAISSQESKLDQLDHTLMALNQIIRRVTMFK